MLRSCAGLQEIYNRVYGESEVGNGAQRKILRILALQKKWRYYLLELGRQICWAGLPAK